MPPNHQEFIVIDVETSGLTEPVYVIEIGAQLLVDGKPHGEPFRRLINRDVDIDPHATRVHGYDRARLAREGDDPMDAYAAFERYVGDRSLVAYNLPFDWDRALQPEYGRLGLAEIGSPGFCALKLARRVIPKRSVSNYQLQTLREHYELPERMAHSALDDVLTTVDLLVNVLLPLRQEAEASSAVDDSLPSGEHPEVLDFGKHRDRHYSDALKDRRFRSYFEWMANSDDAEFSAKGQWYLAKLAELK